MNFLNLVSSDCQIKKINSSAECHSWGITGMWGRKITMYSVY